MLEKTNHVPKNYSVINYPNQILSPTVLLHKPIYCLGHLSSKKLWYPMTSMFIYIVERKAKQRLPSWWFHSHFRPPIIDFVLQFSLVVVHKYWDLGYLIFWLFFILGRKKVSGNISSGTLSIICRFVP
jgi:hypothetical protein